MVVLIPWVLVVSWLKGKRGVDQIEIDVVQLQPVSARLNCGLDALRAMIVVPQLGRNEQILAGKQAGLNGLLNRLSNLLFISVSFRAIKVAESCFQGRPGRVSGLGCIGNQRAESQ